MDHSFYTVVLCIVLIVIPMQTVPTEEIGGASQTIRTKDKHYLTTGSVKIAAPIETARHIIEDTDRWNEWMFTGLDGNSPTTRFLLLYITEVTVSSSTEMNAFVEFRFLRALGKKRTRIPFNLTHQYTEKGKLSGITAILAQKNTMLDSAQYEISLSGTETETTIMYKATVRLRGFFEFFVTLKSYTKTIEWYLEKIIANFIQRALP